MLNIEYKKNKNKKKSVRQDEPSRSAVFLSLRACCSAFMQHVVDKGCWVLLSIIVFFAFQQVMYFATKMWHATAITARTAYWTVITVRTAYWTARTVRTAYWTARTVRTAYWTARTVCTAYWMAIMVCTAYSTDLSFS